MTQNIAEDFPERTGRRLELIAVDEDTKRHRPDWSVNAPCLAARTSCAPVASRHPGRTSVRFERRRVRFRTHRFQHPAHRHRRCAEIITYGPTTATATRR